MPSIVAAVLLAVGAAVQFITAIEARRAYSAELLAAIIALAGAAALMAFGRRAGEATSKAVGIRALAFATGAAGLFGAPYVVLLHRYSDAPPGSEILFLTTAAWAVMLALLTLRWRASDLVLASGALLVLGGVAGTVGNWERPSSFSPFIRYSTEEYWMLAGGLAWAFMWWFLDRALRRDEAASVVVPLAAGGVTAALLTMLVRPGGGLQALAAGGLGLGTLFVASAVTTAASVLLLRQRGPRAVAGAYAMPAAAITSLTWLEQATGAFGPQPILLAPAFAGAATTLAGVTMWWVRERGVFRGPVAKRWALPLAWVSVAAAAVGLAMPALQAQVTGLRTSGQGFEAQFVLRGIEVVGPWLALGISLGAAATVLSRSAIESRAAALFVAIAVWPLVGWTPLHTLTRFIPAEVQVDFGSEFASIAFSRLSTPFSYVALCGSGVVLALSLAARYRQPTRETEPTGER